MKLPFDSSVPPHYYEMALEEAGALLPGSTELTSIKIRPILKWPIVTDAEFGNAYVYPSEYSQVYRTATSIEKVSEGTVSRGKATVFRALSGEMFLFVEHETGPEIITGLALATASVSLLKEIVVLIKEIINSVNDKNEEKKTGKSKDRYYEAAAISIEERTSKSGRVMQIITLPLKGPLSESEIEVIVRKTNGKGTSA